MARPVENQKDAKERPERVVRPVENQEDTKERSEWVAIPVENQKHEENINRYKNKLIFYIR